MLPFCSFHTIVHQLGNGHGPYSSGNWSDGQNLISGPVKIHITAEMIVLIPVDTYINNHCSFFYICLIKKAGLANSGNQNIRPFADLIKVHLSFLLILLTLWLRLHQGPLHLNMEM